MQILFWNTRFSLNGDCVPSRVLFSVLDNRSVLQNHMFDVITKYPRKVIQLHLLKLIGHMGSLFTCKSCGYKVYLITQKEELVFPEQIQCPLCGEIREYLEYELQQERYDLTCPVCKGRFFIRKLPPIRVRCPHSNSLLYVRSDGNISIIEIENPPVTTRQGAVGGALGGMVLGGLIAGGEGALLGTLSGAVLGSAFDVKEPTDPIDRLADCIHHNEYADALAILFINYSRLPRANLKMAEKGEL